MRITNANSPASFFRGVQWVANFSKPMYLRVHMMRSTEMALPSFRAARTRDLYSPLSLDAEWMDSQRKMSMPTICETGLFGVGRAGYSMVATPVEWNEM